MRSLTFTGTQQGLSPPQRAQLSSILQEYQPDVVRHGCCIGADADFDSLVFHLFPQAQIHIYPSNLRHKTAHIAPHRRRVWHSPAPPLQRNEAMVDATFNLALGPSNEGLLLACPKESIMQLRSGTWATVRYALSYELLTYVIFPNGKWERHGN